MPAHIAPLTVLALAAVLLCTAPAQAQYAVDWYTVDAGGQQYSAGGAYTLVATIGQPDAAGLVAADHYRLAGGFWPGPGYACFVDMPELLVLCQAWLASGAGLPGDLDASGDVDLQDYALLAAFWLDYCPAAWSF